LFFSIPEEKEQFLAQERPGSFHSSLKLKETEIELYGLIDHNQVPAQFQAIKYHANLSELPLVLLDVLVEFATGKDIRGIETLSLREIESFLRDDNITPAFKEEVTSLYPLFESIKKQLKSHLEKDEDSIPSHDQLKSPTLNKDYQHKSDYFPFKGKEDYVSLDTNEKMRLIAQIIEDHIAGPLRRDNGGIYCVFADDGLVVIEYTGSCQSCQYSLSSTLNFIQKVFQLEINEPSLMLMTDS
jgi:Fe-S cluster biogenesis protein NfuA